MSESIGVDWRWTSQKVAPEGREGWRGRTARPRPDAKADRPWRNDWRRRPFIRLRWVAHAEGCPGEDPEAVRMSDKMLDCSFCSPEVRSLRDPPDDTFV